MGGYGSLLSARFTSKQEMRYFTSTGREQNTITFRVWPASIQSNLVVLRKNVWKVCKYLQILDQSGTKR